MRKQGYFFLFCTKMFYPAFITAKLPKWFGVRPGRRSDDPQTPDDGKVESQDDADDLENIGNIEDLDVAGSEEEEEEEEEEYEEEDDYE